jgi:hypothetical protein
MEKNICLSVEEKSHFLLLLFEEFESLLSGMTGGMKGVTPLLFLRCWKDQISNGIPTHSILKNQEENQISFHIFNNSTRIFIHFLFKNMQRKEKIILR